MRAVAFFALLLVIAGCAQPKVGPSDWQGVTVQRFGTVAAYDFPYDEHDTDPAIRVDGDLLVISDRRHSAQVHVLRIGTAELAQIGAGQEEFQEGAFPSNGQVVYNTRPKEQVTFPEGSLRLWDSRTGSDALLQPDVPGLKSAQLFQGDWIIFRTSHREDRAHDGLYAYNLVSLETVGVFLDRDVDRETYRERAEAIAMHGSVVQLQVTEIRLGEESTMRLEERDLETGEKHVILQRAGTWPGANVSHVAPGHGWWLFEDGHSVLWAMNLTAGTRAIIAERMERAELANDVAAYTPFNERTRFAVVHLATNETSMMDLGVSMRLSSMDGKTVAGQCAAEDITIVRTCWVGLPAF